MAGGTFDSSVGKIRPGTYINFEAASQEALGSSERGTVVIPLINHTYGLEKEFITISGGSVDSQYDKLGFSVYDDNPSMLLIREALKNASTVIVYIPRVGTKASGTGGGLKAEAKYGGTRGNDLRFTVEANPINGFDVAVYLGDRAVEKFEGISSENDLSESKYISFSSAESDEISETAGINLSGGTDVCAENADITKFLDDIESVDFNTLAFPVTTESLLAACVSKIRYLRENTGRGVKAVVADYKADYEGVINVTNSVSVGGKELTNTQAVAWVAGADAGADGAQSNTYKIYTGADSIVGAKTHEQSVAAIKNGEFFFSYSENGNVVVEYDINSLTTFSEKKNKSYSKNKIIRILDRFSDVIKANFPPNKFSNSDTGWDVMEGIGRAVLKQFYEAGMIKNVDYAVDFAVDRGQSVGDSTYFNVAIEPVDSAEKLYFTIKTR